MRTETPDIFPPAIETVVADMCKIIADKTISLETRWSAFDTLYECFRTNTKEYKARQAALEEMTRLGNEFGVEY